MNATRRHSKAIHDLRDYGCTCTPRLIELPRSEWPTGSPYAFDVTHHGGCPLGDRSAPFNACGVIPAIGAYTSSRCDR